MTASVSVYGTYSTSDIGSAWTITVGGSGTTAGRGLVLIVIHYGTVGYDGSPVVTDTVGNIYPTFTNSTFLDYGTHWARGWPNGEVSVFHVPVHKALSSSDEITFTPAATDAGNAVAYLLEITGEAAHLEAGYEGTTGTAAATTVTSSHRYANQLHIPARAHAALPLAGTLLLPAPLSAQQPTMEGYPAAGAPTILTLVDPGAEPRVLLRWRMSPGQRTTVLVTVDMSIATQLGDRSQRVEFPTVKTTLDNTVTDVSSGGDISVASRTTGVTADATGVSSNSAALQKALASLSGATLMFTLSDRGNVKERRLDLEAIPDAQVREQVSATVTSLVDSVIAWPEEAVGVGARWMVRRTWAFRGASLFAVSEFELVSMQGRAVTLTCRTEAPHRHRTGGRTPRRAP